LLDSACSAIYPIDTATDAIGSPVSVAGKSPQELLLDHEGKIWVMAGNQADGVQATLSHINPNTGGLLKSYSFGKEDPVHPVFNNTKDTLYFILVKYLSSSTQSGIFRMSINDASLPSSAFVSASGLQNFWGLGIHPKNSTVYVADPLGFTQRGRVSIYNPDGSLINSFQTGVGPGHFLFD
jgi:DNA-binding beta-propeller fold protein YncE